MSEARGLRVAGWCGIVFSVLSLIVLPLSPAPPPPLGASAEALAAYYTAHHWGFLVGNFLGLAAFPFGLVQLAALTARVRARESADGWLWLFILASGAFGYAVFFSSLVVFEALPFLVDPASARALSAFGTFGALWFALDGLAALPLVVAVAWATVATQALPRWFAHLSWALAALALLMSLGGLTAEPSWLAGGGPATLLGFVAVFAWTLVLGIIFLRLEPTPV